MKGLAKDFVKSNIPSSDGGFLRGFLGPLFENTLRENPVDRISDLSKTPLMSIWSAASPSAIHAALAIHAGLSELTFDMFRVDTGKDVLWAHQQHILNDLERACATQKLGDQLAVVYLQTAFCFAAGFGTVVDFNKASQYIRKAQELSHPLSGFFPNLLKITMPEMSHETTPTFTKVLCHHLKSERTFMADARLVVSTGTSQLPAGTQFNSYRKLQQWTAHRLKDESITQHRIQINPFPYLMNYLEVAIAFNDAESVSALASKRELLKGSAFGETPLIQAFRKGNRVIIESLTRHGAGMSATSKDGGSVLHWLLLLEDDIDLVCTMLKDCPHFHTLLECFASPRPLHVQWPVQLVGTPLSFAVSVGCLKTVRALLGLGAQPAARSFVADRDDGDSNLFSLTPIHLAVKFHRSRILQVLLAKEYSLLAARNRQFGDSVRLSKEDAFFKELHIPRTLSLSSPIERYIIRGTECTQELGKTIELIPFGLMELPSPNGQTALMKAIECNDLFVVTALLNKYPALGAQPFRDPGNTECYTFPLHFAAQVGSERDAEDATMIFEHLLRYHSNGLYAKDDFKRTALHLAVTGVSARVTSLILKAQTETSLNDSDHLGRTALHVAKSLANTLALLDAGASIDITDKDNLAPIHLMILANSQDCAKELVWRDARFDIGNNLYGTPLHCAVIKRSRPLIELLGEAGRVNAQNVSGPTALHLAVHSERLELVQFLIEKGADALLRDQKSSSSLDMALSCGEPAIVDAIVGTLPNLASLDEIFIPALHRACFEGQLSSIERFLCLCSKQQPLPNVNAAYCRTAPLLIAASSARVDVARLLLKFGANVNACGPKGDTPLLVACAFNQHVVPRGNGDRAVFCELLFKHGASLPIYQENAYTYPGY